MRKSYYDGALESDEAYPPPKAGTLNFDLQSWCRKKDQIKAPVVASIQSRRDAYVGSDSSYPSLTSSQ